MADLHIALAAYMKHLHAFADQSEQQHAASLGVSSAEREARLWEQIINARVAYLVEVAR